MQEKRNEKNNFKHTEITTSKGAAMFINKCIDRYETEIRNKSLKILIWGPARPPNDSDKYITDTYNKRVEIKEYLKMLGHATFFSEDISEETLKRMGYRPNPLASERIQIEEADLAIMLRVSPGTITEFISFHGNPSYARKMCVYFNQKDKGSLVHQGADDTFTVEGGKLVEFSYPKDIIECNLKSKIKDYVEQVQIATFNAPYRKYK